MHEATSRRKSSPGLMIIEGQSPQWGWGRDGGRGEQEARGPRFELQAQSGKKQLEMVQLWSLKAWQQWHPNKAIPSKPSKIVS